MLVVLMMCLVGTHQAMKSKRNIGRQCSRTGVSGDRSQSHAQPELLFVGLRGVVRSLHKMS